MSKWCPKIAHSVVMRGPKVGEITQSGDKSGPLWFFLQDSAMRQKTKHRDMEESWQVAKNAAGLTELIIANDYTTPASFNFETRSSTVSTFSPAWRVGGSSTLMIVWRGVTSTPKSAAVFLAIGFFLAFCS